MASTLAQIAQAVADELNAAAEGTFAEPIAAVRSWRPEYRLAELAELHVTVVPRSGEPAAATRGAEQTDWLVHVGVQKRLGDDAAAETAEVDAVMELAEQVAAYLRHRPLPGAPTAHWLRTTYGGAGVETIADAEHLGQLRCVTAVLAVTYRTVG